MEEQTYNLEEIIDFKNFIPNGEYVVKLIDAELVNTETTKPYLQATFTIQEGDLAGNDFPKRYYLSTFKTKNGGTGCYGLSDFRREVSAIGADAQLKQKFTTKEFLKMYAQIFAKKKLKIHKSQQKDSKGKTNENGTPLMYDRFSIFGVVSSQQVASGVDPLADMGF